MNETDQTSKDQTPNAEGQDAQTDAQTDAQAGTAPGQAATATAAAATQEAQEAAPAGTTTPGALFDMAPTKPEPKKGPSGAGQPAMAAAKARPEPEKYPEGTEVRYGREKVTLPKEMTAKEVLDWLAEDDYPELKYEETEVRHDKEKNRLVVVRKAQKKGAA